MCEVYTFLFFFSFLLLCFYELQRLFRRKENSDDGTGDSWTRRECRQVFGGMRGELTITDLKTEEQLASSLKKLSKFSNIRYILGRHDLADFQKRHGN